MVKTIGKFASMALALGLVTGCASNEQLKQDHLRLEELDKLVQGQSQKILEVENVAKTALAEAQSAESSAERAQAMAQKCNQACEAHMEKMFHKSMMK